MSSLRGRTRDSSWQWLAIGVVLGLGCSGVFCLGLYLSNVIRFSIPGQGADVASAPTIIVITQTSAPVTATTASAAVTATSTQALQALPSATPLVAAPPTLTPFEPQPTDANAANTGGNNVAIVPTATVLGTVIASPVPPTQVPPTAVPQDTSAAGNNTAANSPTALAGNVAGANPSANTLPPSIPTTELVTIQGGIFEMGTTLKEAQTAVDDCTTRDKGKCDLSMAEDSYPPHNVTVNSFRIERYEVSYEQYVAFLNYLGPNSHLNQCEGNPCVAVNGPETPGSYIKFDGTKYSVTTDIYLKRPIAYVTWYGASMYCHTVGRRLPTEAEWERTARDSDKRIYPWGNDWDPTNPKARTSRPKNEGGPDQVDSYKNGPSAEGILNLAGNVSEWVDDWYDANYYKSQASTNPIDPKGPKTSPVGRKVTRGGDWDALPFFARSVHRRDADPLQPTSAIGFRCAADQDLTQPAGATKASVPTIAPTLGTGNTGAGQTGNTTTLPTATFTAGALPSGNKP